MRRPANHGRRIVVRWALLVTVFFLGVSIAVVKEAGAQTPLGSATSCPGCAQVFDGQVVSDSASSFRVVWSMDRTVYPRVFILEDPRRLVVDFEPAWSTGVAALAAWTHPLLRGAIRPGWHGEQRRLRFVFDLHSGIQYDVSQDIYLGDSQTNPARFVLGVSRLASP
jgi:hypothetical protein